MPPNAEGDYRIDRLPTVNEQILTLAKKAAALGIRKEFFRTLKAVVEQLRTRPLDWGDPERKTRKKGGYVCNGLLSPLLVKYVLYEAERAVCILEIRPFPRSSLDRPTSP